MLLVLMPFPLYLVLIDRLESQLIGLLIFQPQIPHHPLQMQYFILQPMVIPSPIFPPPQLIGQDFLPILQLSHLQYLLIISLCAFLAALQRPHQMHSCMVRVVRPLRRHQIFELLIMYRMIVQHMYIVCTYKIQSHTNNMEYINQWRQTLERWGEVHPVVDFLLYHIVTITVLGLILLTICIHRVGSARNLSNLTPTHLEISPFLAKHFTNYTPDLIIQSPNIIKSYASGNPYSLFLILAYAMVPRQQFVSFFCNWWLIRLKDEIVVEVPIKNERPIPVTLAVIRKKNIRMITKKDYPDIKYLCKEYKPLTANAPSLPQTHSMLIQNLDHIRYILPTQKQTSIFRNHSHSLKLLYLSDVNKFSRYPMAVRLVLQVGKDVLPMLQWLMGFVERMSKVRMAVNERRQARRKRQQFNISYQK